jgi:hypothetical protein
MTFYESNPEVRPTGEEPGEYVEDLPGAHEDEDDDEAPDPRRRPTGSPPLEGGASGGGDG